MSMFSMASMTDVIFLLLIFFMVTSTFVSPSALEVNLPQSSQTTSLKPTSRIYIDSLQQMYCTTADSLKESEPRPLPVDGLDAFFAQVKTENDAAHQFVAVHADEAVPYGKIVEVLDAGSKAGVKVVLATRPTQSSIDREAAAGQQATATSAAAQQPAAQQSAPVQGLPK